MTEDTSARRPECGCSRSLYEDAFWAELRDLIKESDYLSGSEGACQAIRVASAFRFKDEGPSDSLAERLYDIIIGQLMYEEQRRG